MSYRRNSGCYWLFKPGACVYSKYDGNIVLLGIAAGSSLQLTALHSITALSGFVLGVLLAVVIGGKQEKHFGQKPLHASLS